MRVRNQKPTINNKVRAAEKNIRFLLSKIHFIDPGPFYC